MIRHLRLCGALSLFSLFGPAAFAQDDVAAILRRLETLEQQVSELRRQAGVQTAVETVARELRHRRPHVQKFRVAGAETVGPGFNPGEVKQPQDAEMFGPGEVKQPIPSPVVPDRIAMTIAGVEIRRQEIDDYVRFARSVIQGSDEAVMRHVVQQVILPRCRRQGAAGDSGKGVIQRAHELRQQVVDGGRDFAEVARESSQDTATAAQGGTLPALERSAQPMALAKAAFETAATKVSPIVMSELGVHFLLVEKKAKADPQDPASPLVVTARQVLLTWPPVVSAQASDRVELFDPSLRAVLPAGAQIVDRTTEFEDQRSSELPPKKVVPSADADGVKPLPPKKGG